MSGHLEVEGLTVRIGRRDVVADVNLTVEAGQSLGVLGVNGSGKSTLLRALAGLRTPHSGRVLVDGEDLGALRDRERARRVALVAQEAVPPTDLLVGELVALARTPHRSAWMARHDGEDEIVRAALEAVGMRAAERIPCGHLSGGERRRVMLARGIAQATAVLLLDEPTNHLDVRHQVELLTAVRALGRTVIAAMHDLDLTLRWCDQVAVLHEGRIHAVGPPAEVLTPALVATVFGVRGARITHPADGRDHLIVEGLA